MYAPTGPFDAIYPAGLGSVMKVLIVDEYWAQRMGLSQVFQDHFHVDSIREAEGPKEALRLLAEGPAPDVIVADLNGHELSVVDLLADAAPSSGLVLLTHPEDFDKHERAIDKGAHSVLSYCVTPEEFKQAVKVALDREIFLRRPRKIVQGARNGSAEDSVRLTPRQTDVLKLLAEGKSNSEIAEHLGMSPNTVRIHVSSIFRALNVDNRTQAALWARGHLA
ncbi:MAG: response regulator transcription factor [Pseudomonadota bacterium]